MTPRLFLPNICQEQMQNYKERVLVCNSNLSIAHGIAFLSVANLNKN